MLPDSLRLVDRAVSHPQSWLEHAGEDLDEAHIHGEWMGVVRFASAVLPAIRDLVTDLAADPANRKAKLHHFFEAALQRGMRIRVVYTTGHWLDVDSLDDVLAAGDFS